MLIVSDLTAGLKVSPKSIPGRWKKTRKMSHVAIKSVIRI
jgi:hypothetical protein